MSCSWSTERFARYLDDELTPRDRALLRTHVDRCDGCYELLEELRVVDGLLLRPRTVELPADFTGATMADVRSMPAPCALCAPVTATIVAYLVGAWSVFGAALLIAPQHTLGLVHAGLAAGNTVLGALNGLLRTFWHLGDRGDVAAWLTLAGGIILGDAIAFGILMAIRALRPRIAQRVRF